MPTLESTAVSHSVSHSVTRHVTMGCKAILCMELCAWFSTRSRQHDVRLSSTLLGNSPSLQLPLRSSCRTSGWHQTTACSRTVGRVVNVSLCSMREAVWVSAYNHAILQHCLRLSRRQANNYRRHPASCTVCITQRAMPSRCQLSLHAPPSMRHAWQ